MHHPLCQRIVKGQSDAHSEDQEDIVSPIYRRKPSKTSPASTVPSRSSSKESFSQGIDPIQFGSNVSTQSSWNEAHDKDRTSTPSPECVNFGMPCLSLQRIHEAIFNAGKSDLEILQGIQQAVLLKLEELQEERRASNSETRSEDWVTGVEAVDDHEQMCGSDRKLGAWEISRLLGSGAFGNVFAAKHVVANRSDAVKVISKGRLSKDEFLDACSEYKCLQKLPKHKNIATLMGALQSAQYIYLFQEFARGNDLFQFIKLRMQNRTQIPLQATSRIFLGLASALACCHSHNVCHRDLKPENVIVDRGYTAVLVDFGCACACTELRKQCVGSMPFIAPECLLNRAQDGAPADVWSLGILVMEMTFGLRALSKALTWDDVLPNEKLPSIRDCGMQLLELFADPAQAITFVQSTLKAESVAKPVLNLLASMLQADPKMRPSMESLEAFTFSESVESIKPDITLPNSVASIVN